METARPKCKKLKTMDESEKTEKLFSDFEIGEIISDQSDRKLICVTGKFTGKQDTAVVILEKSPFSEDNTRAILSSRTLATRTLQNDIYGTYNLFPEPQDNNIKTTVIYPATQKHIDKYRRQNLFLINETKQDYADITLPFIENENFSIKWVYNILEKKQEAERIVFEDDDKETGFVLIPDMKWNHGQLEDLYLIAIIHRRGVKSLRDLTANHLPLLENIRDKGNAAILSEYGLGASKLRTYLHYQPSYYHLHVHFTHVHYDAPGSNILRAHLLQDVIDNLHLDGAYYTNKTLSYTVKQDHGLCHKYKEAGHL